MNQSPQQCSSMHQKRNSIQLTVLVSFSFGFVNWTLYWRSPCPGICFKGDHSTKHPSSVMLLTLGAAKMKKKKCIFRPRWWCKECIYYFVLWAPPLLFKNVVGFLKIHDINVSIRFKICTSCCRRAKRGDNSILWTKSPHSDYFIKLNYINTRVQNRSKKWRCSKSSILGSKKKQKVAL